MATAQETAAAESVVRSPVKGVRQAGRIGNRYRKTPDLSRNRRPGRLWITGRFGTLGAAFESMPWGAGEFMEQALGRAGRPAVFLDRDGVLNERVMGGYVRRPDDLRLLPGVPEALRRLRALGYFLIVVTNQQGVGKGLMSEADLEAVHRRLNEDLAGAGARLDSVYACPHLEGSGCGCRKPEPGMLLRAIAERNIDPAASWLAGDAPSDLEAARRAGVRPVLIGPPEIAPGEECPSFPDLLSLAAFLEDGRGAEVRE
jgi:D-glycero-D-manno-heptose 1,7-bisphosphate phosphatase